MQTTLSRHPRPADAPRLASLVVGFVLGVTALQAGAAAGPDADGLVRQRVRGLDKVYVRPDVALARYDRLRIAPVEVAYKEDWQSQHRGVEAQEAQRIRTELATVAVAEFQRALTSSRKGRPPGYMLVDEVAPGVLEVRAAIDDLDIYAPEIDDAAVRHNYVFSAGKATLRLELRDAASGQVLARVIDSREMRRYEDFQLATRISNSAEARDLVADWARQVRKQIDSLRTGRPTP